MPADNNNKKDKKEGSPINAGVNRIACWTAFNNNENGQEYPHTLSNIKNGVRKALAEQ